MSGKNRVKPETLEAFWDLWNAASSNELKKKTIILALNTKRFAKKRRKDVARQFLVELQQKHPWVRDVIKSVVSQLKPKRKVRFRK